MLAGGAIDPGEALFLLGAEGSDLAFLFAYAGKIRERFTGAEVDLCSIINARSGKCSEDCAFCAQSAHYHTGAKVYDLVKEEEILAAARDAKVSGAHRFDIVISGLGLSEDSPELPALLRTFRRLREETGLKLCACLGTITRGVARQLAEAGVSRYNHNLEAAPSFFPEVVTTHTLAERMDTVRAAREAGMEVCCGGIIGMGESRKQRVELAFALKELDVDSVPVNVLDPRPGTPMAGVKPLQPLEALAAMAMFRFVLPGKIIRYAGGRGRLGELQALGLLAGINGMLIGNYLTTVGRAPAEDLAMIQELNLKA